MIAIRPHAWVTGEQLDLALQEVEFGLSNSQSQQQPEGYLRWADNAERSLGNVIAANEIRGLIHTPRYWAIAQMPPTMSGQSQRVIAAEIEDRLKLIRSLREQWNTARKTWSKQVMNVVLDTSIIIESAESFETFDWASALGADGVRVVVPLIVLDELDGLKKSGSKAASTAARTVVREIQQRITTKDLQAKLDWLGGVLVILPDSPSHVRLGNNDWEIVDRSSYLASVAEGPVFLATFDVGMRARALIRGVKLANALPPRPDPA